MKSYKIVLVILAVIMLFSMMACGKSKAKPTPDGDIVRYPSWWNKQNDEAYMCAYGMATQVSQGASIDAAKANAFMEASLFVEAQVKGMIKRYEEEAGVFDPQLLALTSKVVKTLTDARFSGTITGEQETRRVTEYGGQRYTTYIQLKVPKTEVNKSLYQNIRNEEALYNQFKASQAFQELEYSTQK